MASYTGKVNGIDVQLIRDSTARCQAFINKSKSEYIQVTTLSYQMQSLLELANSRNVDVEAEYNESSSEKVLSRLRILDR